MQKPELNFENSYAALGERFYSAVLPEPVAAPRTIRVNAALSERLGFDPAWLQSPDGAAVLAGNTILPGSTPIATVYAGHQFGGWNPRLGDGRAVLLGELVDGSANRVDLQLKGSGRTPYSRSGDGRSPLGPALREYIVSEAMAALDIPTTRSLAVVATGAQVRRQTTLPGGILARVAASHIRVGTFEYFASVGDSEGVRLLAEHVLRRHFPAADPGQGVAVALLREVAARQAKLIAQWQSVGFIHGVMNTDNMLVSGETIDYGPCAFMDEYDPDAVFSSIDTYGRYAFSNQPLIAQWNLARLATSVLASLDADDDEIAAAGVIVQEFEQDHEQHYDDAFRAKLGLVERRDGDSKLVADLLDRMHASSADFTLTFRQLSEAAAPRAAFRHAGELPDSLEKWCGRWERRCEQEELGGAERRRQMEAVNPAVIPRNHVVESALDAATAGDEGEFHALVEVLSTPFQWPDDPRFTQPPQPDERVMATFCGT